METQMTTCSELSPAALIIMFAVAGFFALISVAFAIFLYCRIFKKTGYPWGLGFLILVPFGNMIILCMLAFGTWPIEKKLGNIE